MKNLYFFQCQESYGNSIYLPYSSGVLWAYASKFSEIKENYKVVDIFFEKIEVKKYLEKIVDPDFVFFSNYGWNTTYHLAIAKEIKSKFPSCKIIIGGPNAQQSAKYLKKHSYIDISVWGEGEQTFYELLSYFIGNIKSLKDVPGLAFYNNDQYCQTTIRERIKNLDEIPSPYLTGIFDSFFERYNYNFMPIWETNRGCPYSCTFCDLGNEYYNKLYSFSLDRLLAEIDYFSEKKIEYVEIADPNFGILKRDLDITKYIKEKNSETGYPQKINATWAKSSPERLFEMSKILDSINRGGVTLALQSSNETALKNIKRVNIANKKLAEISKKYSENNIQTYHDFILGLPGETLETWKEGLLNVVDLNPEGWIFGHPLEAYENTEFSDPRYIEQHNLKFVETPQISFFSLRNKNIPIELGKYVISTTTLTKDEYIECFLFKWFLICTHSLGWCNIVAHNVEDQASKFYSKLYNWMKVNDSVLQRQYNETKKDLEYTFRGNFWGKQVFGENDIFWEYESASCIVFEKNRQEFFNDIKRFLKECYSLIDTSLVDLNDQQLICFDRNYLNKPKYVDFQKFCIDIYWYGRRKKAWKV